LLRRVRHLVLMHFLDLTEYLIESALLDLKPLYPIYIFHMPEQRHSANFWSPLRSVMYNSPDFQEFPLDLAVLSPD
jgi:hypothetical protein